MRSGFVRDNYLAMLGDNYPLGDNYLCAIAPKR